MLPLDRNEGFGTDMLERHMPILKEKLGAGIPLKFELSYTNAKVELGQYGYDIVVDYTVRLQIFYDIKHPSMRSSTPKFGFNELLYDEIPMTLSMDLSILDDKMFAIIKKFSIRDDFDRGAKRMEPKR